MHPSYNHNVRYRGLTLHVQTEDSGTPRCVVVTHLFVDGDIIATQRYGYDNDAAHHAPQAHTAAMQAQHQALMRALIHGSYDDTLMARGITLAPKAATTP